MIYTIAVIVVMMVIWLVIGGIVFAVIGMGSVCLAARRHGSAFKCRIGLPGAIACAAATMALASMP